MCWLTRKTPHLLSRRNMTAIYLTESGTVVSFKNQSLLITRKGDTKSFRLAEVSLWGDCGGDRFIVNLHYAD